MNGPVGACIGDMQKVAIVAAGDRNSTGEPELTFDENAAVTRVRVDFMDGVIGHVADVKEAVGAYHHVVGCGRKLHDQAPVPFTVRFRKRKELTGLIVKNEEPVPQIEADSSRLFKPSARTVVSPVSG